MGNEAAIACSILRRVVFPLCGSIWGERECQCQPCSASSLPHAGLGTRAQRQSTGVNSGTQRGVALGQQTLLSSQGKLQNSRKVWLGKGIKDHPVPTPLLWAGTKSPVPLPAVLSIALPGSSNPTKQNGGKTELTDLFKLVKL